MEKIILAGQYLVKRLNEPSSHAAIGAILLTLGVKLDLGVFDSFVDIAGIAFTTLGFFIPEKK